MSKVAAACRYLSSNNPVAPGEWPGHIVGLHIGKRGKFIGHLCLHNIFLLSWLPNKLFCGFFKVEFVSGDEEKCHGQATAQFN